MASAPLDFPLLKQSLAGGIGQLIPTLARWRRVNLESLRGEVDRCWMEVNSNWPEISIEMAWLGATKAPIARENREAVLRDRAFQALAEVRAALAIAFRDDMVTR